MHAVCHPYIIFHYDLPHFNIWAVQHFYTITMICKSTVQLSMSVRLELQAVSLMPPVLTHLAALSARVMKVLWEMGEWSVEVCQVSV